MLYLDTPIYYINGLQIHRDFQNINQFYYFPAAPRIHRENGEPAFQLLKYARDVTDNPHMPPEAKEQVGGAFLVFTVDIGVDEEILDDTKRELAAFAEGEVMLAPVPFHTGSVRLLALGANEETLDKPPENPTNIFVEKVFGASKPSLYGENLAILGLHLDQEGATLLDDSFRHGGGLLGVVYDLTYAGIRPALQVKAKVDFKRVYQRFEANLGFQYATIGAEIGAQLEWLREQRAIEIEITQYDTDPATAKELRKEAMELIKQEVIGKMFKPSLQVPSSSTRSQGNLTQQVIKYARELSKPPGPGIKPPAPPPQKRAKEGDAGPKTMGRARPTSSTGDAGTGGGGRGASPGFALTFSLKYLRQEERKTATFDFRINQAVNRTAAPQGSLRLLLDGLRIDDYIREVNLDDPFFRELRAQIGVSGDYEALGIDKVVVNATYQPDPAGPIVHTDGWTFNAPTDPVKLFNVLLDRNRPIRLYKYKTEIFLKNLPHVDSKEQVLEVEDTCEQRQLLINPANEFQPLLIKVEPGPLNWNNEVRQVDVRLRYSDPENGFEADQLFIFRSDRLDPYDWVVYPQNPQEHRSYTVTYTYHLQDGTSFELEPEERSEEGIIAPPPFKGTRRVRVIPAVDKEDVREITAEILFKRNGYRFHRELLFEQDNFKAQNIEIPVPDPDPDHDSYKTRWSILKNNWETYEVGWSEYQTPLLILDDGVHSIEPVIVELDQPPEEMNLKALRIKLESLDPNGDVVDTDRSPRLEGLTTKYNFDLSIKKGTPLRYRYTLTKYKMDGSREVLGPFESNENELYLEL